MKNRFLQKTGAALFAFWAIMGGINAHAQITYIPVSVTQSTILTVDIGVDTTNAVSFPLQLNASVQGGKSTYTYVWRPGAFMSDSTIANPICVIPQAGAFTITCLVTDANGCTTEDDKQVISSMPSIKEFEKSGVELYPNPAKDIIYLRRLDNPNPMRIVLLDVSGRTIFQEQWINQAQLELNIGHLSSGLYLLQLESQNQIFQQKVNIQK